MADYEAEYDYVACETCERAMAIPKGDPTPKCPSCGRTMERLTPEEIARRVLPNAPPTA